MKPTILALGLWMAITISCFSQKPEERIVGSGMEYLSGDIEKDSVITYSTFIIIQKGDEQYEVNTGTVKMIYPYSVIITLKGI